MSFTNKQINYLHFKLVLIGLILVLSSAIFIIRIPSADAAAGQLGVEQITLNPGGGINTNGSDGIRFTINSAQDNSWPGANYAGTPGQDAVAYRNTVQYCCSAGGPMLNVGGTLYGQAGPTYSSASWNSIEIVSTSGVTSIGSRTSSTGNSSAVVRYTVVKDSRTYTIDRTVSYTFPNDYVTDTYSFTIPSGNTDTVKFYIGGDAAPGSSDQGYGVMLTEPVRSVISLNTSSQIMFGFREIAGSKAFDGATSQSFSTPYSTVQAGGNIGFVATGSNHDAGLMMQWNLGSTPGVQTASFQQFATQQGTNLNASFGSATANIGDPVQLNFSVANTVLTTVNNLAYTASLPSGLVIGSGSKSNTCGGTLTANSGDNTITLAGGSVGSASNCVITVPVVAANPGSYTFSSSNISSLTSLTNNVGTSSITVINASDTDEDGISSDIEDGAPNGGDANNDGTQDSQQDTVASFVNSLNDNYNTVAITGASCSLSSPNVMNESSNSIQDSGFTYTAGFVNFKVLCDNLGETVSVTLYTYGVVSNSFTVRKYNPNTNAYFTIKDATLSQTTISNSTVTLATYNITDGGDRDIDGLVNREIVDPVGLGTLVVGVPNTGFGLKK